MKPLLLIITMALLIGCNSDARLPGSVTHPHFWLEESSTRRRFYINRHRGRIVLLVFVSTNCRYCQLELGALGALKKQMDEMGVVVASILMDPESRSGSADGSAGKKFTYPVLLDWKRKVADQFNIYAVPTTVVIGRDGAETLRRSGYNHMIMREIQNHLALLAEKNR